MSDQSKKEYLSPGRKGLLIKHIFLISFDRGFSSVENRELLELEILLVVIPKKGKLSQADRERQSDKK